MWDFGRADVLESEAIGQPGQRTFRLRVQSGTDAASLWLEKEQLAALTLAIRQLLEQTAGSEPGEEAPTQTASFPEQAQVDFKLGRLGIGYDESARMVSIFAYSIEDEAAAQAAGDEDTKDTEPTFSCLATREQCRMFADHAEDIISAGRPVCVLCGGPIEDGEHRCGRRNGHSTRAVSLE